MMVDDGAVPFDVEIGEVTETVVGWKGDDFIFSATVKAGPMLVGAGSSAGWDL